MKKGHKKLLIISFVLAIIAVINCVFQVFNLYTYALFLLFAFLIIKKLMGMEDDNFPNRKEIIIIILGCIMFYYVLTYATVFFWGILTSKFVLSIPTFFNNVFPLFLIIIFTELIRFIVVRKGRRYTSIWIILMVVFSIIEISLKIRGYDFSMSMEILKFYLEVVLVCLAKNILLCYLTNISGFKTTIIYRFLMDIPFYLLPFFPNLELLIDSIVKTVFPILVLVILILSYKKLNNKNLVVAAKRKKMITKLGAILVIVFSLVVVGLASMKFSYFSVVVGSGSMSPNIEKGDVVIIKKLKDVTEIKKDDILVFKQNNSTVIHRVSRIEHSDSGILFYTKGDANNEEDFYPVNTSDVIGISVFKIKYLGYPTIWLSEQLN